MLKLVILIWRRPDLSLEEFRERWLGQHAQLVDELKGAIRMRRYVQNHVIPAEKGEAFGPGRLLASETCDGVIEGWWDSAEDLYEGFNSPDGRAASMRLSEDEQTFMDVSRTVVLRVDAHPIFDEAPGT